MLKQWLLAAGLVACSFGATAAENAASPAAPTAASAASASIGQGVTPAAEKMVRESIAKVSSKAVIDEIDVAPIPGFYMVIVSGQMLYVSADGKYMLNGELVDLSSKQNTSKLAWANFRKAQIAKVPASQRIVFAPAHPKVTISVFTDVNCAFCRALHEHIADFNKAGIAVEYLAWPREGVTTTAGRPTPTYTEMVSVWCASDRKAAFSAAIDGKAPKPATCTNPVKDQFDLGLKLGLDGTPTIYGPDGRVLGGYVTPDQLLRAIEDGSDVSGS
ncbi:thioredoxin fold domain-containing protein [Rhodanobacter sp. K2T2]|uniref:disulfide isomerase DsbC N-terminal domain-containing protein n=1 Tax=Rhodanobacter sp. K2T2 TaxID=2723085 RepID=UPI0015C9B02E|nr:thioredoxin fold domain-containing protein [Rhodanobacter sp. K2T2]